MSHGAGPRPEPGPSAPTGTGEGTGAGTGAADGGARPTGWVLGVDSGGSGVRVALAPVNGTGRRSVRRTDAPVATGVSGIGAAGLLDAVLPAVRAMLAEAAGNTGDPSGSAPDGTGGNGAPRGGAPFSRTAPPVLAVAVGAAGTASLGEELRAALPAALGRATGARRAALAADGVTAYAGALGARPGVVVAAGTGMIALGTDLRRGWRRADGWGHLLGDCGGGAWIGRAGLEAALREHDGRNGGSRALLEASERLFGPAAGLPSRLYPRQDRPAVLASFAPEVARCAGEGDPVAARIVVGAGTRIAEAAAAVCPRTARGKGGAECPVAYTGGLFGLGEALLAPVREELRRLCPGAVLVPPEGDPLDGALRIASGLASDDLGLPVEPPLLQVSDL